MPVVSSAYPFHEISKIQPEHVLNRLTLGNPKTLFQTISENSYRSKSVIAAREPFIVLEQMIIQSIRINDYELYKQSLNLLTTITIELTEQAKAEYNKTKNLVLLADRTDRIVQFSYRLFIEIKIEAFATRNEILLIRLLADLESYINSLHAAKAIQL